MGPCRIVLEQGNSSERNEESFYQRHGLEHRRCLASRADCDNFFLRSGPTSSRCVTATEAWEWWDASYPNIPDQTMQVSCHSGATGTTTQTIETTEATQTAKFTEATETTKLAETLQAEGATVTTQKTKTTDLMETTIQP